MLALDLVARIYRWFGAALERRQSRRELLELDERTLRDIGVSREDVEREAAKPFWRL